MLSSLFLQVLSYMSLIFTENFFTPIYKSDVDLKIQKIVRRKIKHYIDAHMQTHELQLYVCVYVHMKAHQEHVLIQHSLHKAIPSALLQSQFMHRCSRW